MRSDMEEAGREEIDDEIQRMEKGRLERNKMRKFNEMEEPYKLALEDNDWEGLIRYFEGRSQDLLEHLTLEEDNVFHIVALVYKGKDAYLLEKLIDLLPTQKKHKAVISHNCHENTVLHQVAASGNLKAAEFLLDRFGMPGKSPEYVGKPLLEIRNQLGETPLYRAAALGHTKLVKFFADRVESMDNHLDRGRDKMSILHITVIGQRFETALWLQTKYDWLAEKEENDGWTSLQLLAQMPLAFKPKFHKSTWKMLVYYCLPVEGHLVSPNQKDDLESSSGNPHQSSCRKKLAGHQIWCPTIKAIWKEKKNQKALQELTDLLIKRDNSWMDSNKNKDTMISLGSKKRQDAEAEEDVTEINEPTKSKPRVYSYGTPLLIATKTGAVAVVEKILKVHPQAIEHVSDKQRNILHVAIRHRQYEIFKLVKSRKTIFSRLAPRIDVEGNTILHQASDSMHSHTADQRLSGPAMQLRDELLWVQRVQKIIPHHYPMHCNNKKQTAVELFNEKHADLLKIAQGWMKDTTQACTVVAVLVATLVFAAAYTVPGGNDQNSGLPIFLDSPFFWVFTIMDITSLASSLASVVMFLSILISPMEYSNFRRSLPNKLIIGFALLFMSMITTMLAFSATIFLLIHDLQKKWTRSLVYTVALLPVIGFGLVQFPLYRAFTKCVKFIFKKILPRHFRNSLERHYLNLNGKRARHYIES